MSCLWSFAVRFTRLSFAIVFLAAVGVTAVLAPSAKADPQDKVEICHIPPDSPENVQVLSISTSAAQKHIDRHGDFILTAAGELCDGRDNDCDRQVDEDFTNLGAPCSDGQGGCLRTGSYVCAPDQISTACSAVAGEPQDEICDNQIDDDCDEKEDCGDEDCFFDSIIHDETSPQFVCKDPECGDGFVDVLEACDESASGCCDGTCEFVASGVECQEDGNECTLSLCDGEGACQPQETTGMPCSGNGTDACSGPDTCLEGMCNNNGPTAVTEVPCNGIDDDCDEATLDQPSEGEICDNGIDDNCDGLTDDEDEVNCEYCAGCGCP